MSQTPEARPARSAARPRGWVSLYVVAFILMLGAGACLALAARGFLEDLWLLWLSAGLSAAAIVLAIAGIVAPRRP